MTKALSPTFTVVADLFQTVTKVVRGPKTCYYNPISKKQTTMTNQQIANIVAQRVSDRVLEDMSDLIADLVVDVLLEQGRDTLDEDAFETLMDVSSRIYIGAQ